LAAFLLVIAASQAAADTNDYPTEARADYVFVCMKTNGETQEMLRRCSCSIDVNPSLLPYDRYVAQTVASMNQVQGQIGTMFRPSQQTKAMLDDLRRAQAEVDSLLLACGRVDQISAARLKLREALLFRKY
jgi:hypothetical protein